jgi:hypothetical protein
MNVFNENDLEIVSEANTEITDIDTEIDSIVETETNTDIDTDVEMDATCSDIDTELETNMERVAINDYFAELMRTHSSSTTLTDYVKKRKSLNCAINTTT